MTGTGAMDSNAQGLPAGRMALLFAVMLITAAGNTAMQSVMPSIGTHLGIADVWVSLAYSWSALLWMVLAPFWARRSDRLGRKAMMSLGLAGFALSFALCGLALLAGLRGMIGGLTAITLFALARSLYGTFGSAAPPAVQAYVASRTGRTERTKALSLIASSFGLGTALGPALAPLLIVPGVGLIGPFIAFTLGALGVLVVLWLRLPDDSPQDRHPENRAPQTRTPTFGEQGGGWHDTMPAENPADDDGVNRLRWGDPRIRQWLLAGVLGGQAQSIMLGVIGFLLLDRLGLRHQPDAAAGPIGLVLMCGAIAMLLAQWGLIPMLALGPRMSTMLGMGLVVAGVVPVALGRDLQAIATGFCDLFGRLWPVPAGFHRGRQSGCRFGRTGAVRRHRRGGQRIGLYRLTCHRGVAVQPVALDGLGRGRGAGAQRAGAVSGRSESQEPSLSRSTTRCAAAFSRRTAIASSRLSNSD